MTQQEKIIISAYTGYMMTDWYSIKTYIKEKTGIDVGLGDMINGNSNISKKIKNEIVDDFRNVLNGTYGLSFEVNSVPPDPDTYNVCNCCACTTTFAPEKEKTDALDAMYGLLKTRKERILTKDAYCLEKCGEFLQTYYKRLRGELTQNDLDKKSIETLMEIYIYLIDHNISDDEISRHIAYKCNREIDDYNMEDCDG